MIVRLIVAAIIEILGTGVGCQEPLQEPIVDRQQEQRSTGGVAAGQVAVLEQVMEDGAGLAAGVER